MRRSALGLVIAASVTCVTALAACGSSDSGSKFGDGTVDASTGSGTTGAGSGAPTLAGGGGTTGAGGIGAGSGGGSGGDGGTTTTTTPNCNAATEKAALSPVKLVVMLDHSGSMGDGTNGIASQKWDPVTGALESFFGDPSSTNITASLQFFSGGDCNVDDYTKQAVAFTALPDAAPFTAAVTKVGTPAGATPTLPALTGALTYASSQRMADTSGAVYAVVLVTDGDPNGCPDDSVQNVAKYASTYATAKNPLLTYVVGIGVDASEQQHLTAIATGGGTTAIGVTVGDPTKTTTDLLTALDAIREQSVSCTFAIPPPPAGQMYAANAVTVTETSGDAGAPTTLPYDAQCTASGWHYDDPTDPAQIILCGDTCIRVKADPSAGVAVSFGCQATTGSDVDGGVIIVR
jgi:hypothetical protein